ncbi:carboxylesterase [Xylariaceae sp. FL0804]|nr:carboxylesterase [Xylariaceae sp. FL0804]
MLMRLCFAAAAVVRLCLAQASAPVVDLGYERYQGYYNATAKQNIYKGIRYAAAPVGELRWQLPQAPENNNSAVISAVEYASQCPQSGNAPGPAPDFATGSEDCLFLNIEAPANASKLPVLVWIHGGGYGAGNNQFAFSQQILTNHNSYLAVSIQYRLGAFGFLSSAELALSGIPNAGIYDQHFALEWVQKYIHLFGGDPEQVTISGESAGGGSVMLQAMANGGTEGETLFKGAIASSPYLPTQSSYDGDWPTKYYEAFAAQVGCAQSGGQSVFDCLVATDTDALQIASGVVSVSALYGQWAFIPVTDGTLIQERPSMQLHYQRKVNGARMLTSNNENEGVLFTPQNVTDRAGFEAFVLLNYPTLSAQNLSSLAALYDVPADHSGVQADSNGLAPPFSTTNSDWAVGWQQAVNNLYAESTFVCPSYWLSDAFSAYDGAWKYQFSVPPSTHGADLEPIMDNPATTGTGIDSVFRYAIQNVWGNFITAGDPTLRAGQMAATTDGGSISAAGTGVWARWGGGDGNDVLLNFNMTGGAPVTVTETVDGSAISVTSYRAAAAGIAANGSVASPLRADLRVAQGTTWEGGRGKRCDLWAQLGKYALN